MRKWNAAAGALALVLLLIHGIAGGFQLMGVLPGGNQTLKVLAFLMLAVLAVHAVLSLYLGVRTLRAQKRSGAAYLWENRMFAARRISGLAVLLFAVTHLLIFWNVRSGAYRLALFEDAQLLTQVLLVLSVAVHVLTSIRPLLAALGLYRLREYGKDLLFVLSVILLFCAAAFLVYYFRWNVLWK